MINMQDEIFEKNIDLLWDGYWYAELPPILDIDSVRDNLSHVIELIEEDALEDFQLLVNGTIESFKNVTPPSYIYNDGIEPITFFEFKNNGALREMQIPNLKYYIAFVYNTLSVYDELFSKLYNDEEMTEYVKHSNSYLLFNELFYVYRDYDGDIEEIESGIFAVKNNKITGQLSYNENNIRFLESQGSKLYTVKIDIESFFPNVYTHYLGKIKNKEPFKSIPNIDDYFDFLDYYNMKTNNNQTKGIAAGVFSSTLSAELLMLCIDYEINQVIGDDIEYLRYVDDMTFFCDSLEEISSKLPLIQRVLNKYRLRINNNKTETKLSVDNKAYVDMQMLKDKFTYLNRDKKPSVLDKDVFYNIKGYISRARESERRSEIKAFLTMLKTAISSKHLIFDAEEPVRYEKYMSNLMIQLAQVEPTYASRCYKIIEAILNKTEDKEIRNSILGELKNKNSWINKNYHDSLVQIWHYYLLAKYDESYGFKTLENDFEDDEINPIIVASFISEGEGSNKSVFNYIIQQYLQMDTKEAEPNAWKQTILFSKWWLPLCLIYNKDGKNYKSYFDSNSFNEVYKIIFTC